MTGREQEAPARVRPYSDQPCWYPETDHEVPHYDTAAAVIADKYDPDDEDPKPLQMDRPCWVRQCIRPGCANMDDGDGTFRILHYAYDDKPADDYDCLGHLAEPTADREAPAPEGAREAPLSDVEMVLYNHYRHLDCPGTVDPADPEDCASVAVESIRALSAAGYQVVKVEETDRVQLRAIAENARALALASRNRGAGTVQLGQSDVVVLADVVLLWVLGGRAPVSGEGRDD